MLTRFLLVFEAASLLLLIAAVGGVVLARRRRGLDEDEDDRDRLTPLDILRPRGTGTMVEGVEGLALAHARGASDIQEQSGETPRNGLPAGGGGW